VCFIAVLLSFTLALINVAKFFFVTFPAEMFLFSVLALERSPAVLLYGLGALDTLIYLLDEHTHPLQVNLHLLILFFMKPHT